jgi:hypothetical protein
MSGTAKVEINPEYESKQARGRRLAKNELLFRELNENIEAAAVGFGRNEDVYEFVCECATTWCLEHIKLRIAEYERARGDGTHFIIAPGHENAEIEHVVETHQNFSIVAKIGIAAAIAESADPRAGSLD